MEGVVEERVVHRAGADIGFAELLAIGTVCWARSQVEHVFAFVVLRKAWRFASSLASSQALEIMGTLRCCLNCALRYLMLHVALFSQLGIDWVLSDYTAELRSWSKG